MKINRTKPDVTLDDTDKVSPGYKNMNTAWWEQVTLTLWAFLISC